MSENRHSSIGIHGLHAHESAHGVHRIHMLKRTRNYALIGLCVLGLGAAAIVGQRIARAHTLADVSQQQATRYVNVTVPKPSNGDSQLRLPGTLQGFTEAPIYARSSGYVSRWYKDIGDQVKKGDLLALIDTPEVEQQLNEAKANLQLAQATFDRWESLRKRDAVSQQEFDEKRNTLATATATVKRLQDQLGYSRVVAPFSGVVTRRNIDIGNLIDAGGGARILFTLAQSDPLRVYVYVPQTYVSSIKAGDKAEISLKEIPGRVFEGNIVRTAGAIDTATRTMQVEVNLANKDGKLLPGAYAEVAIKTKSVGTSGATAILPGNTLLFRPEGTLVAMVSGDGKAHLVPVHIVRELGSDIEVSGVNSDGKVIVNPPDSLADGDAVSVIEKDTKPEAKPTVKDGSKGGAA